MKKGIAAIVVLATLVATAVAQDNERRREGGRRGGMGRRGPSIAQMIERLNEQIEFDEDQKAQIDEIVAAQEERMAGDRARWQEMREAQEAGDEKRVAELREQFRQQRGERGGAMEAVLTQIEPLLREDQLEGFKQFREEMGQRQGRDRGGRMSMRQVMRDLPDAVKMTDEQRKEFEELLEERRAGMRERMAERRQQEDGEEERAGRRERPDFAEMYDELFEQVAEILDESQLKLLSEYRTQLEEQRDRSGRQQTDDVQTVISAAKRIRDLSEDQKDSIREIERESVRASRELRRDREELALLAAEVKAEIVKLLDDEQTQEFQQNLDRLQSRNRRGERERRDREEPRRDRPKRP